MNSIIIRRIRRRLLKENKNALILVVGETGSSKSISGMGLCLAVDPGFTVNGGIAWMNAKNFLNLLNYGGKARGNAILWDDVGKGLKRRDWYETVNKITIDVLQTFRVFGLCVVFTIPDQSYLDPLVLKLFHYYMEAVTIDFDNQTATFKFMEISINRRTGKVYYKYPRCKINNQVKVISRLTVGLPPQHMVEEYKRLETIKKKEVQKEAEGTIQEIENKKAQNVFDPDVYVKKILNDPKPYIREYRSHRYFDHYGIAKEHNLSMNRARVVKGILEHKYKDVLTP